MSLDTSVLVPVNKPHVITARTVSPEFLGIVLSRDLSESLPTPGVFQEKEWRTPGARHPVLWELLQSIAFEVLDHLGCGLG